MDLQSIATESQTLRSTIRDLCSVIATDKERLERHEGELKAALERVEVLEREAQVAFASIRAQAEDPNRYSYIRSGDVGPFRCARCGAARGDPHEEDCIGGHPLDLLANEPSPFGEPEQQSAA